MNNSFEFWEEYLKKLKSAIRKLCKEKEYLKIDLHIHSNYSADGKQTLNQIITSSKESGFDIISITDHDSLDVYDELYNIVNNGMTSPLIIPGIEFTMDNIDYGNQCHFLQLFINPKDEKLIKDVEINYNAMFNRSKIQFKRLKENIGIQQLFRENKIKISYDDYLRYLNNYNLVPEYDTLSFYLMDKFKKKNINTFTILDILEKTNESDCYLDRKKYKSLRYQKLREKYEVNDINCYNCRFLLSMLAVREVDDDWWDEPSSGSLSVNSYGQHKVDELSNNYKIFFAHPTEKKLSVVEEIIDNCKNIVGLEMNYRNTYSDISNFYSLLKRKKLLKIIGSDSHDNSLELYKDMDFYKIASSEIIKIILKC